jgi:hypothetical protein
MRADHSQCSTLTCARTVTAPLSTLLCAVQIGLPGAVFEATLDVDGHRSAARMTARIWTAARPAANCTSGSGSSLHTHSPDPVRALLAALALLFFFPPSPSLPLPAAGS